MHESNQTPVLLYDGAFNDLETPAKGYFGECKVRLTDGKVYPVFFYDPVRLAQDLKAEVETGSKCIAEMGMIIVPKVTLENMERAVKQLAKEGYFKGLKSLK